MDKKKVTLIEQGIRLNKSIIYILIIIFVFFTSGFYTSEGSAVKGRFLYNISNLAAEAVS